MKRHGSIAIAVVIYWVATAILVAEAMRRTGGRLVYPLDDAYVHMAIARNVALHHVWGVTQYAFTSSTSSPLWTLLLALTYTVFGAGALAPLAFNVVAGTLVVVTIGRFLQARGAGALLTIGVLAAAIVVTPLPTLTLAGMEHTAHALATLWFVFGAASLLASQQSAAVNLPWPMIGLAMLVTSLRYEGLFAVGVVVLLFAFQRRWREAIAIGAAGALPIVVYGLWAMQHGWYFLPNSVLLKGQSPAAGLGALLAFVAGSPALHNMLANLHVLVLVIAALALLLVVMSDAVWNEDVYLLTILVGATLLHMQLARAGWFYRYEAYLLVLGAAIFGVLAAARLPSLHEWTGHPAVLARSLAVLLLAAVAGFPFASRGLNGFRNAPTAASNIYSQQYQMGLFVERFYPAQSVALNDIGAVGYLSDARVLDVYGLANLEIAGLKRAGRHRSQDLADMARRDGTVIAMIYPSWLNDYGGVPSAWTKVGEWGVRDNVVLGENAVSFYAVKDNERSQLAANLRQFAPQLPGSVVQAGEYTR